MSKIDLTNLKVLKNYIKSQLQEGKCEVYTKEKVKIAKTELGEFVIDDVETIDTVEKTTNNQLVEKTTEESVEQSVEESTEESTETTKENDLDDLRKKFFDKFKTEVPVNKKNNIEWIINKINE